MVEGLAGDRDDDVSQLRKIRQTHAPRLVDLTENHFLLGTVKGAPGPDAAFEGAPHACAKLRMAPHDLLEDGDRAEPRGILQKWNDLALPDPDERVGPATLPRRRLLGGLSGIVLDPVACGCAEPGLGGRDRRRVCPTELHEQPHLAVGDMAAGQRAGSSFE